MTIKSEEPTGEFEPAGESDSLNESDPFHPNNVGTIQFIMLARIYDLLMVDLNSRNPEVANQVLDLHKKGVILGPAPVLNGQFVASDEEEATDQK